MAIAEEPADDYGSSMAQRVFPIASAMPMMTRYTSVAKRSREAQRG
jgi:hypothetical protein